MKHKKIFYYKDGLITEYSYKDISHFFIFFYPNIGIISYKNLNFIKKNYPKKIRRHLRKIILEEVESLFPNNNLSFLYQIVNEKDDEIELSIWIYEESIKDQLVQYGCSYIIPEPLIYAFNEPTVVIYQADDYFVLILSFKRKVINYLTTKTLSKEILSLFLKSSEGIDSIRVIAYIKETNLNDLFDKKINVEYKAIDSPLFIEFIKNIELKKYRIKRFSLVTLDPLLLLRVLIYLILSTSLSLYLINKSYDEKILEIENKLRQIKAGLNGQSAKINITKIQELRDKKHDIFYLFASLANLLPQGSSLKKLNLNEETMEIMIYTKEPLVLLNNLNFEPCFTSIKLFSPIIREGDMFSVELKIGLSKCKYPEN